MCATFFEPEHADRQQWFGKAIGVPSLAGGCQILVALMFFLAVVEKARWLISGTSEWHPVLLTWPLSSYAARLLLGLSAVLDAAVALGALLQPRLAAPLGGLLLLSYTAASRRVEFRNEHGGCACFAIDLWPVSSYQGLMLRNSMLVAAALVSSWSEAWLADLAKWPLAVAVGLTVLIRVAVTVLEPVFSRVRLRGGA